MTFVHTFMLFGLLATLVPIILHLMNRRHAKNLDWGAMQFLLGSLVSRKRRILIEEMMLLAMRCLLIALFVLAIARPIVPAGSHTPWWLVLPALLLGAVALGVGTAFWQERAWRYRLWMIGAVLLVGAGMLSWAEEYLQLRNLAGPERDLAIVIDASSSMRLKVGDQTNFDRAVGEAREMLKSTSSATSVSVLLAGVGADVKTKHFTNNPEEVDKVLAGLKPVGGSFSAHEAIQAASANLKGGANSAKEIILFTDGQKSGWSLADTPRWEETVKSLESHQLSPHVYCRTFDVPDTLRNMAITRMSVARKVIGTDLPLPIDLTVENTGNMAVDASEVTLFVGDKMVGERLFGKLEPGETEKIRFSHRFDKPGSQIVRANCIVKDDLADDNTRTQVVQIMEQLPVLVVNGNPARRLLDRASAYIQLALNPDSVLNEGGKGKKAASKEPAPEDGGEEKGKPKGLVKVTVVEAAKLSEAQDLSRYRAIVLADVPRLTEREAARITDFVATGGGLLVAPGERAQPEFYNNWKRAGDSAAVLPAKLSKRKKIPAGDEPTAFALGTFSNPAVARFAGDGRIDLDDTRIFSYWQLISSRSGKVAGGGNLNSGDPFILEHQLGDGRVLITSVALGAAGSDLVGRRDFPVLTHSLLYHVADAARADLTQPAAAEIEVRLASRSGRPLTSYRLEPGLTGEYFNGRNFETPVAQRVDAKLDFNWAAGSPLEGVEADNFSARWSGFLVPRHTEEYKITVKADEVARVWIDDKLVISGNGKAKLKLEAGRRHGLRVELEEGTGSASVRLGWASKSQPNEAIPADRLGHHSAADALDLAKETFEIVEAPSGASPVVRGATVQGAGLVLQLGGAGVPGVYRVKAPASLGDTLSHLEDSQQLIPFAVVPDADASRIELMTADERKTAAKMADLRYLVNFEQVQSMAKGETIHQPLWRWMAVAALIILLAEIALTRWIAIQRQTTTAEIVDFQEKTTPTSAFRAQLAEMQSRSATAAAGGQETEAVGVK